MREFEFEEGMVVHFSRVPGTRGCDSTIDFTDSTAAVRGLAIITEDIAKRLGVPVEKVLCKLATVLIRPEEESQTVGKEEGI